MIVGRESGLLHVQINEKIFIPIIMLATRKNITECSQRLADKYNMQEHLTPSPQKNIIK